MADVAAQIQLLIELANVQAAALAAAQAAAVAAVPPVPLVPAAAPVFALFPGLANQAFLDYNTSSDRKIYSNAIVPLSTKFGLSSSGLQVFLEDIKDRARTHNWNGPLSIPDDNMVDQNLLDKYGLLSLQNCQNHATTYVATQTRLAQDAVMLFMFIRDSLTEEAKNIILIKPSDYTVAGQPNGPCLLKVIIGKSSVDTIATVNILRQGIANLPNKMTEYNSNVKLFNVHALQLRNSLVARGQSVDELLMNLFRSYEAVADDDFVRYIQSRRDSYEDGAPLTVDALMSAALNKYELKVENETWSVSSAKKDSRFIALEAEIERLKFNKNNKRKKLEDNNKYAWKLIPPGLGEKHVKVWNKKTYYWCIHHAAWTVHKPENCNKKKVPGTEHVPPSPASSTVEKQEAYLSKAFQALMEDEEDDVSDN